MQTLLNKNDVFDDSKPGFGSGGNNPAKVLIGAGVIADPYEVRAFIGDLFTNKTGFFDESKLSIDAMTLLEFETAIKTADRELKKTEFLEAFKLQLGLGGKQSWKREVLDASKEFMRAFEMYMQVRNELQQQYEALKNADAAHSDYAGETFLEFMKRTENRTKRKNMENAISKASNLVRTKMLKNPDNINNWEDVQQNSMLVAIYLRFGHAMLTVTIPGLISLFSNSVAGGAVGLALVGLCHYVLNAILKTLIHSTSRFTSNSQKSIFSGWSVGDIFTDIADSLGGGDSIVSRAFGTTLSWWGGGMTRDQRAAKNFEKTNPIIPDSNPLSPGNDPSKPRNARLRELASELYGSTKNYQFSYDYWRRNKNQRGTLNPRQKDMLLTEAQMKNIVDSYQREVKGNLRVQNTSSFNLSYYFRLQNTVVQAATICMSLYMIYSDATNLIADATAPTAPEPNLFSGLTDDGRSYTSLSEPWKGHARFGQPEAESSWGWPWSDEIGYQKSQRKPKSRSGPGPGRETKAAACACDAGTGVDEGGYSF